jgi:O-antigen ligase
MAARLAPVNWTFLTAFLGLSMFVGLLAGFDPKFAIAASIAAAFALIVFADLTAGLALFVFFSFLELLGSSSVVSVGKLGGVFLAIAWIALLVTRGDNKIDFMSVHAGMSLVMGLFLGWVALSALWAESTPVVLGSFGRYLLNLVLFMIVFTAVRTKRQALYVIGGFVGGAGAASIYGLLFAGSAKIVYGDRITGAGLDPNELASVLVAGIALSVGLAACLKKKPGLRLAAFFAAGFCFLAALLTGSRGGIVALACMLVAAILFSGRYRGRVTAASVVLALLGVFYITALAPADIRDRIQSSSQGETQVMEGRTTLWQMGERMVRAHPVNGVGAGNFKISSRHYLLQPGAVYRSDIVIATPQVTHNTYLQVAAELGIVGLALFGSIIVFSVGSALRGARHFRIRGDPDGEILAICIAVALVGVLAADTFISQQFNKQLWLLLGLGPAILAVSRRAEVS